MTWNQKIANDFAGNCGPSVFEKQDFLALFKADYRAHPKLIVNRTPYLA